jgi:hypothetical protein
MTVPTQLEKTAAFLKKFAAEEPGFLAGLANKGMWGADGPFTQPAPGVTQQELIAANAARANDPEAMGDAATKSVTDDVSKALNAAQISGKPLPQSEIDRLNTSYGTGGKPLVAGKEAPGMVSNYLSALARGHVGTVAATGAAALLAGVLTYNMLKKKSKGNITQMPGQRKVADMPDPDEPTSEQRNAARPAEAAKNAPKPPGYMARAGSALKGLAKSKAAIPTAIVAALGGGAALGHSLASPTSKADLSGGKTWAGKNLSVSSGNDIGDAAIGVGAAGLGALGLYQLYKKIRGSDE